MESPDRFVLDHHHLFDWRGGAGLGSDWVCSLKDREGFSFGGRRRMSDDEQDQFDEQDANNIPADQTVLT
jgi:hypothetical protein